MSEFSPGVSLLLAVVLAGCGGEKGPATYPDCAAASAAGVAPLHRGEPGYSGKLDQDGDGVACEPKR